MSKTRIALLGLGAAAQSIHLPACSLLDDVEMIGGADPNPEARSRFAATEPKAALYDTPQRLLEAESPDWVIVAAPPAHHRDLCLMALEARANVLCEKPFVESAPDAKAILSAETTAQRHVVVNHEFAQMPIFMACRQKIASQEFGELLFVQAWEHLEEITHDVDDWRRRSLTLREFGTHVLDLIVYFYDSFPEKVYAQMANPGGSPGSDLVDVVTLDFGAGRLASIVLDRVCRGSHRYLDMRLDGTQASMRASIGGRAALTLGLQPRTRRPNVRLDLAAGGVAWLEKGEKRNVIARNPGNAFVEASSALLKDAITRVACNQEPRTSARRALEIVRLVDAIYASAASGNPTRFDSSLPAEPD